MSTRLFLKTLPKKYYIVKVDDSLKFCLVMINLIRIQTNNNTLKVNIVCTSLYLLSSQLWTYSLLQIGRLSGKRKLVYNINNFGKNCIQWKMLSCNNNIYFTVGSWFQYLHQEPAVQRTDPPLHEVHLLHRMGICIIIHGKDKSK